MRLKTLTIKRTVDEDLKPCLIFELDGKKYPPTYVLSRVLTNTTNESGYGIFTQSYNICHFHRGDVSVTVEFTSPLNLEDSLPNIMAVIFARVKEVKAAFQAKSLPVDEVVSYDF